MQSVPGFSMFDSRRVSPEELPVCKVVNLFLQEMDTADSSMTVSKTDNTKIQLVVECKHCSH